MNDSDIYDNEAVQNLLDTLKELKRKYNSVHDRLQELSVDSDQRRKLVNHRDRINEAMRDTKRLLDDCIDYLRSLG